MGGESSMKVRTLDAVRAVPDSPAGRVAAGPGCSGAVVATGVRKSARTCWRFVTSCGCQVRLVSTVATSLCRNSTYLSDVAGRFCKSLILLTMDFCLKSHRRSRETAGAVVSHFSPGLCTVLSTEVWIFSTLPIRCSVRGLEPDGARATMPAPSAIPILPVLYSTRDLPYSGDSVRLFAPLAHQPWAALAGQCLAGEPGRAPPTSSPPAACHPGGRAARETRIEHADGRVEQSRDNPLQLLGAAQLGPQRPASAAPFARGALGYFAYDLARRLHRLPTWPATPKACRKWPSDLRRCPGDRPPRNAPVGCGRTRCRRTRVGGALPGRFAGGAGGERISRSTGEIASSPGWMGVPAGFRPGAELQSVPAT